MTVYFSTRPVTSNEVNTVAFFDVYDECLLMGKKIRSESGCLFADTEPAGLKHRDLGGLDLVIEPGICCSSG